MANLIIACDGNDSDAAARGIGELGRVIKLNASLWYVNTKHSADEAVEILTDAVGGIVIAIEAITFAASRLDPALQKELQELWVSLPAPHNGPLRPEFFKRPGSE